MAHKICTISRQNAEITVHRLSLYGVFKHVYIVSVITLPYLIQNKEIALDVLQRIR